MTVSTEKRNSAPKRPSTRQLLAAILLVSASIQCITVSGANDEPIQTYLFEIDQTEPTSNNTSGPVLLVSNIRAEAAAGSRQILYVERAYELSEYRRSQWADRPARMLQPILQNALEASGEFSAIVGVAFGSMSDLRLDAELLELLHEHYETPSQARVRMRVQLVDLDTREVVGTRTFEETEPAPSNDAYGGVSAMNIALSRVMDQIVAFAVEAARARGE